MLERGGGDGKIERLAISFKGRQPMDQPGGESVARADAVDGRANLVGRASDKSFAVLSTADQRFQSALRLSRKVMPTCPAFGKADMTAAVSPSKALTSSRPAATSTGAPMPSAFWQSSSFAMPIVASATSSRMTSGAVLPYCQRFVR